jgi:hypothetical protein
MGQKKRNTRLPGQPRHVRKRGGVKKGNPPHHVYTGPEDATRCPDRIQVEGIWEEKSEGGSWVKGKWRSTGGCRPGRVNFAIRWKRMSQAEKKSELKSIQIIYFNEARGNWEMMAKLTHRVSDITEFKFTDADLWRLFHFEGADKREEQGCATNMNEVMNHVPDGKDGNPPRLKLEIAPFTQEGTGRQTAVTLQLGNWGRGKLEPGVGALDREGMNRHRGGADVAGARMMSNVAKKKQ